MFKGSGNNCLPEYTTITQSKTTHNGLQSQQILQTQQTKLATEAMDGGLVFTIMQSVVMPGWTKTQYIYIYIYIQISKSVLVHNLSLALPLRVWKLPTFIKRKPNSDESLILDQLDYTSHLGRRSYVFEEQADIDQTPSLLSFEHFICMWLVTTNCIMVTTVSKSLLQIDCS